MNRRRFIVNSASAAAATTALVTDACTPTSGGSGGIVPVPPPPGGYTLTAERAVTTIKGYTLRTRTFNGRTTGPTLVTRPGQHLRINYVNKLGNAGSSAAAMPPQGPELIPAPQNMMQAMMAPYRGRLQMSQPAHDHMNNPHGFDVTNLHVHGLQTVPHLFDPVGTSDPHSHMIEILPGENHQYDFPIVDDQPSGLYWYHPHKHGSVDVQVSGGMAGLIVVRGPIDDVPEIRKAREILFAFQTLEVNKSKKFPGQYDREYKPYKPPTQGGYNFGTEFTMFTTNGEGVCWIDNNKNVYTPLGVPQYKVQPGEVLRLRMLNGTNGNPLFYALPGFETYAIGFDGINLLEPTPVDMSGPATAIITADTIFSGPAQFAGEGNRIELLVRAPKTPGTYTLTSLANTGVSFEPIARIDLAEFVVAGAPVHMDIPKSLPKPKREYPHIKDSEIVNTRTLVFSEGPSKKLLTGFAFFVNGKLYDETDVTIRPKVGTAEEWTIENSASESHVFHIHVNSFEVVAINGKKLASPQFWDTFIVPPKTGSANGSITFRTRFKTWFGKAVLHCHILPHEDTGMMDNVLFV